LIPEFRSGRFFFSEKKLLVLEKNVPSGIPPKISLAGPVKMGKKD
jgi:hypothetical protein